EVLKLVVKQGARLALAGIAIGLAISYAVTRLVANLLIDVPAYDPLIFVGMPLLLGAAALVGSAQPAWRASRVDRTVELRLE
ncbi:MAG: hypothetical protein ACHP85_12530, partial [Burkholderiales bacterium]